MARELKKNPTSSQRKSKTINNLLEKINNMDEKFARLEKTNSELKRELDSCGGGGDNYNDNSGSKRPRNNNGNDRTRFFEKRRAEVKALWAKKIASGMKDLTG